MRLVLSILYCLVQTMLVLIGLMQALTLAVNRAGARLFMTLLCTGLFIVLYTARRKRRVAAMLAREKAS